MLNKNLISRLSRIDWDFAGAQSDSPFSALHWHPARLPSQVAATLIGLLSGPGDVVLDPFVGSGTTATEAQRLGRLAHGFDINPISCLICEAKTLACAADEVAAICLGLKSRAASLLTAHSLNGGSARLPPGVQRKWYAEPAAGQLTELWRGLEELRGPEERIAKLAFSSALLPVCRETRHWGYVCDNSTPKGDHAGDVLGEFCGSLDRLAAAYRARDESLTDLGLKGIGSAQIECGDSARLSSVQPSGSVRLVLTSPPYFGVSDYVKSQRLSLEWMGLEIEPLRRAEIGARSKRHRAAARKEYIEEVLAVFTKLRPALRKDGAVALILGESARRQPYMRTLLRAMAAAGYDVAFTATRRISPQRRQYAHLETEQIAVLTPGRR